MKLLTKTWVFFKIIKAYLFEMAAALSFMLLEQNIGNFTVEESA